MRRRCLELSQLAPPAWRRIQENRLDTSEDWLQKPVFIAGGNPTSSTLLGKECSLPGGSHGIQWGSQDCNNELLYIHEEKCFPVSWIFLCFPGSDYDWALMKLQNGFPSCERALLEDIVMQCNGDFRQAYALLSDTLNWSLLCLLSGWAVLSRVIVFDTLLRSMNDRLEQKLKRVA